MKGIVSGAYQRVTDVGRVLYSQQLDGTGAAVPVSADDIESLSIILQAAAGNGADCRVGNADRQDYALTAGSTIVVPIDRLNLVYVFIPQGDVVNVLASLPAGG